MCSSDLKLSYCAVTDSSADVWGGGIDVEADGFLYNMMRAIAGTLINVGRGFWPEAKVGEILAANGYETFEIDRVATIVAMASTDMAGPATTTRPNGMTINRYVA